MITVLYCGAQVLVDVAAALQGRAQWSCIVVSYTSAPILYVNSDLHVNLKKRRD
uniref:Uncharacterized protein n=1 Tax=Zea mays TaxID=4577 RepID=B4G284_MAIZE|nr:unknown [Zea mays]